MYTKTDHSVEITRLLDRASLIDDYARQRQHSSLIHRLLEKAIRLRAAADLLTLHDNGVLSLDNMRHVRLFVEWTVTDVFDRPSEMEWGSFEIVENGGVSR